MQADDIGRSLLQGIRLTQRVEEIHTGRKHSEIILYLHRQPVIDIPVFDICGNHEADRQRPLVLIECERFLIIHLFHLIERVAARF